MEPLSGYRGRYRYPIRVAIKASFFWRVEHLPWRYDGQIFGPLSRWGYRQRKAAERQGSRLG